jgi:hypothetical protein
VDVTEVTPTQQRTFAADTFSAGNWEWQVRTRDQIGVWGPFSSSSLFTAAVPPSGPTITAPADGGTIPANEFLVEWSVAAQEAYQLRVLADDDGAPDTGSVRFDSGTVASPGARSRLVSFPTTGIDEHIQVRAQVDGLFSDWATAQVSVAYVPPAVPTVVVTADNTAGTISVVPTFPTPSGDEPTVERFDVLVRVAAGGRADLERPVGGDGIRIAASITAATPLYVDRAAGSGIDYEYRVRAIGTNTTSTDSAWT